MDNFITLFVAATACVIIYRLFTVLGNKTGNEEERAQEYKRKQQERLDRSVNDHRESEDSSGVAALPGQEEEDETLSQASIRQRQLEKNQALASIFEADSTFDLDAFVAGAGAAYELVLSGFAEGDKKALKSLLSSDLYADFAQAIDERQRQGHKAETEIIGIESIDIVETSVSAGVAAVKVRIAADLVSSVADENGEIVEGDPNGIDRVADLWTFTRPLQASDPNWFLSDTDDG